MSTRRLAAMLAAEMVGYSRLMGAERFFAEPREPSPEIEAFFARNVRPSGPQPPPRKR